jgi:hypothetical protein
MASVKTRSKGKFKGDEIVQCIESFATASVPGHQIFSVSYGSRWQASHPVVESNQSFFVADGAGEDEIQRLRQAIYREAEAGIPPPAPQPAPPAPLKDAEAVVSPEGERIPKQSQRAKVRSDHFRPVVPAGLARKDALRSLVYQSQIGDDGKVERDLYPGEWASSDDPFVTLNPHAFAYIDPRS